MAAGKTLLFFLTIVLALWLLVRLLESRMVFFPTQRWDFQADRFAPAEELLFPSGDGLSLSAVWLPAESPRGVILYCHGNAGNLSHRLPTASLWRRELGNSCNSWLQAVPRLLMNGLILWTLSQAVSSLWMAG